MNNSPRARVIRNLQEWMRDGRLVEGARLPPEMQLAAKFNVSRTTIRLALAELHQQGLIQSGNRKWLVKETGGLGQSTLSNCIVVIVGVWDSPLDYTHHLHSHWHTAYVHMGAMMAIRRAGFDAFVAHPDSVKDEVIQRIISQRPRGAMVLTRALQERSGEFLVKALHEGNIPFVVYGDLALSAETMPPIAEADSVVSDHEAGAYELTKWLIGQGRKKILRMWAFREERPVRPHYWLQQRNLGHERAMKEAGLTPLPPIEIYDANYPKFGLTQEIFDFGTRTMAGYLLEYLNAPEPIDAIMANTDEAVAQLAAALRLHGRVPNKDVLLVGYDNMWEDLEEVHQWESFGPIATVDKRNMEIGTQLMNLLQERIDGKLFTKGERRVVKPNLIVRSQSAAISREPNREG